MQLWISLYKGLTQLEPISVLWKDCLKNALRDVSYTPDIMYHLISLKGVLNS